MPKQIRVALAGNPNSGKTTIFNNLVGARQHVGNYPGVTVEKKEGSLSYNGFEIKVIDLPGTYSLTSYSIDEMVARNFIIEEKWGNVSFFFTRKGFQREELQTQGYPGRENWVGVIRMEKDDKLYVSKAFSFIGGPLDFLLILVLIILGLILSLLLWKIHENRKFQEVEVEWENDKQW